MKKSEQATPNQHLRDARKNYYWTQSQVAEKLGTTVVNVSRWESGMTAPSLYFRQKLCELFDKDPEELGLLPEAERQKQVATPAIWGVPFRRNPYFTGRQDVLVRLEAVLKSGNPAALVQTQAISGLGGIGKTQTAVEYAYRYQSNYRAVLWAKGDSREVLTSDFVELAELLQLPEKNESDQNQVVGAVKGWLKDYSGWLLILDNIEDLNLTSDFLPSSSKGHILLTTRMQSTGSLAQHIDLEKMKPEEGAVLLLRRAKLIEPTAFLAQASAADRMIALELAQHLDGLPLALDQAAAYIEETNCGLAGYLSRYQTRRTKLLNLRGSAVLDHPEPVATTWSLSFEKVQQANPAAADLLRLCAFLHPDAISEEIITGKAAELGSVLGSMVAEPLELDAAIKNLRKYSLVRRDPEAHLLQVHRLVQAVLKDGMDEATQRLWAKRAVQAVNRAFPDVEFETWSQCQRYLPHVLQCAELIEQWSLAFPEAARLLDQAGTYLLARGQYTQAESFLHQALTIREQVLGAEHLDTATSLNNLANLYQTRSKFELAEQLFHRALAIRENLLGPEHLETATSLNELAVLYMLESKFSQAELLYLRALSIRETALGSEHLKVSDSLQGLAVLYDRQGKYDQAELLVKRTLAIREKTLGAEHPMIADAISNLATIYFHQGKFSQVEPLDLRALAISEKVLEPDHPDVGVALDNLATLYRAQDKYAQTETLSRRALAIFERHLGPKHPDVAFSLDNLAFVYENQSKYTQAEALYQRSLDIREKALGAEDPYLARSIINLAEFYHRQGNYIQAEPLYKRGLKIRLHVLGVEHPDVAAVLENLADLLRKTNREEEATELDVRAKFIRGRHAEENS